MRIESLFFGIDTDQQMSVIANFSDGEYYLWSGLLFGDFSLNNISNDTTFDIDLINESSKVIFYVFQYRWGGKYKY